MVKELTKIKIIWWSRNPTLGNINNLCLNGSVVSVYRLKNTHFPIAIAYRMFEFIIE